MSNRPRRSDYLEVPQAGGTKSKNHSTPSHLALHGVPNDSVLPLSEIHARSLNPLALNGSDMSGNADKFKIPMQISEPNSANTSLMQDYSRAKKFIAVNYEMNEEKLKEKEKILKQLQSIDLTKYSFPNETKPKTEYTYAKTYSDYLKEPKSEVEDKCEMPNLCRRSRKSPNSSSSALLNVSMSASNLATDIMNNSRQVYDRFTANAEQIGRELKTRLTLVEYFKSFVSTSNQVIGKSDSS